MTPDNLVGEGSFRTAYRLWDSTGAIFNGLLDMNPKKCVYKLNKDEAIEKCGNSIYFRDAHTQVVAQANAEVFNKISPRTHHLNFAPVAVIHAHGRDAKASSGGRSGDGGGSGGGNSGGGNSGGGNSGGGGAGCDPGDDDCSGAGAGNPALFSVEPFLQGDFLKWNTNSLLPDQLRVAGHEADVGPQAYSHFTYHDSQGDLMVVDIQGAVQRGVDHNRNYMLTDPQIHSMMSEQIVDEGQQLYGGGDRGEEGMNDFFKGHKCSQLCKDLFFLRPNHVNPYDPKKIKAGSAPGALLIMLVILGGYAYGSLGTRSSVVLAEDYASASQQEAKVSRLFSTIQQQGWEVAMMAGCIAATIVLLSSAVHAVLEWQNDGVPRPHPAHSKKRD